MAIVKVAKKSPAVAVATNKKVAAPAKAAAAPAKKTPAEKPAKVETALVKGKTVGKISGQKLGKDAWTYWLIENQNKLHLTDEELAKKLLADFPSADEDRKKMFTAKRVSDYRWYFNKGKLGNEVPDEALTKFGEDGEPTTARAGSASTVEGEKARRAKHEERVAKIQEKIDGLNEAEAARRAEALEKNGWTEKDFTAKKK